MSRLGQRIKQIREYYKLTQAEFSESLQMNQSYLSQIEQDNKKPSRKIIDKLLFEYKADPDWLMDGIGNMLIDGTEAYANIKKEFLPVDLVETIISTVVEMTQSKKLNFTPKEYAKLVGSFYEYFCNADDAINLKEVKKHITISYDIVVKLIKG